MKTITINSIDYIQIKVVVNHSKLQSIITNHSGIIISMDDFIISSNYRAFYATVLIPVQNIVAFSFDYLTAF